MIWRDSSKHFVVMIVNDRHHGSTSEPVKRLYYMTRYIYERSRQSESRDWVTCCKGAIGDGDRTA